MGKLVVVLLDGDADIFADTYLTDAIGGGRRAAIDLMEQANAFVCEKEGEGEHKIIVQIFMNMWGLQKMLGPAANLTAFAENFNRSAYPFSIINTGGVRKGDQAADTALKSKRKLANPYILQAHRLVKDHLRLFSSFADYILLGGTHDGGYAAQILQLGPSLSKRVTLLNSRGGRVAVELQEIRRPIVEFPGIFRVYDTFKPFRPLTHNPGVGSYDQKARDPNDPTKSVKVPEKFEELARLLSTEAVGYSWPAEDLEKAIGEEAIGSQSFARYLSEAEGFGVVESGRSGGHDWVKLGTLYRTVGLGKGTVASEAIPMRVSASSGSTRAVSAASPVLSNGSSAILGRSAAPIARPPSPTKAFTIRPPSPVKAPIARPPSPIKPSVLSSSPSKANAMFSVVQPTTHNFAPLVAAIRASPRSKPLRSQIGSVVSSHYVGKYKSFKDYCIAAEQAGVVELGADAGIGSEWIMLKDNPGAGLVDETTTLLSRLILKLPTRVAQPSCVDFSQFVRILRQLQTEGKPRPLTSLVGGTLRKLDPAYLDKSGMKSFQDYLKEAERLRIITFGGPPSGAQWVELLEKK